MSGRTIFDIRAQEFMDWSVKTFEKATPNSSLEKLKDELRELDFELNFGEIANDKEIKDEYVECLMCLLHSAAKYGFTFDDINEAFGRKMRVNFNRTWKLNENNTYSHI